MNIASKLGFALAGVIGLGVVFGADCASAQSLPSKEEQEILIKTTLLTLNDANLTDDYAVLHAKLSKPFREQMDAEKLKVAFKEFVDKKGDISVVAAKSPIPDADGAIGKDGVLELSGTFDTKPKVTYKLRYLMSEGVWKPLGINVSTNK